MLLSVRYLGGIFGMAQYNYPYAADFNGYPPGLPVHVSCNALLAAVGNRSNTSDVLLDGLNALLQVAV